MFQEGKLPRPGPAESASVIPSSQGNVKTVSNFGCQFACIIKSSPWFPGSLGLGVRCRSRGVGRGQDLILFHN